MMAFKYFSFMRYFRENELVYYVVTWKRVNPWILNVVN